MIYLDNGATTFPKPKGMIEAMERCMSEYCGNPGRSGHGADIYCLLWYCNDFASVLGGGCVTDSKQFRLYRGTYESRHAGRK